MAIDLSSIINTKIVSEGGDIGRHTQVLTGSPIKTSADGDRVLSYDNTDVIDRDWIRSRFMVPGKDLSTIDRLNRFFTSAGWKYTSTRLGENICINSKPQFTRYADVKPVRRRFAGVDQDPLFAEVGIGMATDDGSVPNISYGMGRYYSEAIDDNKQMLFLEFGIPKFNSLLSFFTNAIDPEDAYVARTGTLPTMLSVGSAVGSVVRFLFLPKISLVIYAAKMLGFGLAYIQNLSSSYYYLDPKMHMYWGAVDNLVNNMAVELGLVGAKDANFAKMGNALEINGDDFKMLRKMVPALFEGVTSESTGYMDTFAIVTAAQRRASRALLKEAEQMKNGGLSYADIFGNIEAAAADVDEYDLMMTNSMRKTLSNMKDDTNEAVNYEKMADAINKAAKTGSHDDNAIEKPTSVYEASGLANAVSEDSGGAEKAAAVGSEDLKKSAVSSGLEKKVENGLYTVDDSKDTQADKNNVKAYDVMRATIEYGARWAVFDVEYVGEVSESFSNSVGDISLEGTIKSVGSTAKDYRFNLADGNVFGDWMKSGVETVTQLAMGAIDGATFGIGGVISGLINGAFVDIPKKWEDSEFSISSSTYNIKLRSPYGNPVSALQAIYFPLAMLITAAAPMSVGAASYASPFLCSAFCRGVSNIKLGMITSLSINRGTGTLGFTKDYRPLGFDVSITITDFSNVMAVPINTGFLSGKLLSRFTPETDLGRYLGTMCGRSLINNTYLINRFKRDLAKASKDVSAILNVDRYANMIGYGIEKTLIGTFWKNSTLGLSLKEF